MPSGTSAATRLRPGCDQSGGLPRRRDVLETECLVRLVITVEHFWSEVESVWPHDRPRFWIEPNLREVIRVLEGAKKRAAPLARDVLRVADDAVAEQQPHHVWADDRDADHFRV